MPKIILVSVIFLLGINIPAYSYIGPGLGAGILTLIIGFILTILVALFTIIYFPIKKLLLRFKKNKKKK